MAPGETVCVTGAGGFIASWIVKMLLEKGYNVRGTVRNPANAKHLLGLPGASERLQLVAVDILTPGAFDSIVQGCDAVFHTASPLPGSSAKTEADFLEPAINGTLNVLGSCAKAHPRPKRIVLTSSFATVGCTPKLSPDTIVDETFYSDPDFVRKTMSGDLASYFLSKIYAEEAAWDFVKKHNLSMVVINPVFVTGPTLHSSLNTTNEFPVKLLSGRAKTIPNEVLAWVGVKDVARAHILGYEKPEAEGRYIISERVLHNGDFAAILQRLFPQYTIVAREENGAPRVPTSSISTREENGAPRVPTGTISTKKMNELGVDTEPLEDVLRETIECFRELKYLE